MKLKSTVAFLLLFLSIGFAGRSQDLGRLNEERVKFEKNGMLVLGSWAAGNMIWAGFSVGKTDGMEQGFHQMNLYWNSVNLLIAGLGYYNTSKASHNLDLWDRYRPNTKLRKFF